MESDYKEIENCCSAFKLNVIKYKIVFNFIA